jgi:hypothetical protein
MMLQVDISDMPKAKASCADGNIVGLIQAS